VAGASPRPANLTASPASLSFGATTLGTYSGPATFTLTNTSDATDSINGATGFNFSGVGNDDYEVEWDASCQGSDTTLVLAPSASCRLYVFFFPGALGSRPATISIKGSVDTTPVNIQVTGTGSIGYYQVDQYGDVATAGDAQFYGSTGGMHLNQPIVGTARTPDGKGYWLVASDGGIFTFGDASFYGSTGGFHLNKPIVGMATTPDGKGYWLVASDGGIFSFGDARFYGSTGGFHINQPIVGMSSTPDGGGYWLVASDGGIFSFGDARFYGSTGAIHLNEPILAMAAMPDGGGYWFSAIDGGLFAFGTAPFYGSGVGIGLGPVVDMATDGGPTAQAEVDAPAIRHAHAAQRGRVGDLHLPRMVRHGS
jgi:hypothetical protein